VKETLGPNMARVLLGPEYDADKAYELITGDSGLSVAIIDKTTGERDVKHLKEEPIEPERLSILNKEVSKERARIDWSLFIFAAVVAFGIFTVLGVVLWRLGIIGLA
jgi:hypothetical protein